ncbi:MAG: DUF2029 domain-containing protein [Anaerolineae bacterium]|nr:DUF2029 domain-containing protein [Anaerolineae bacterium]
MLNLPLSAAMRTRLRVYPRLALLGMVGVLLFDFLASQGWLGALGQIVGSDFVTLYAAGTAFRTAPAQLYDFAAQGALQQALIAPTPYPGLNPFISPPYVAQVYALLTLLPLPWAFGLWQLLALLCLGGAALTLGRVIVPESALKGDFPAWQLAIVLLSSFAFVSGFRVGQNHTLTLLLIAAVCAATLRERWGLAGVLAALLLYKPQFALGFLILWLVWWKPKALMAFGTVAAVWVGSAVALRGLSPFLDYLALQDSLLRLAYVEGFPSYIFVTPYGLLATALPERFLPWIQVLTQFLLLTFALGLLIVGYRWRSIAQSHRGPVLALAVLFPFLTMPYTLLHDLLLMAPVLLLAAQHPAIHHSNIARRVLWAAIACYLGALLLPLVGYATGVALAALLPLAVFAALAGWCWRLPEVQSPVRAEPGP